MFIVEAISECVFKKSGSAYGGCRIAVGSGSKDVREIYMAVIAPCEWFKKLRRSGSAGVVVSGACDVIFAAGEEEEANEYEW